MRTFSSPHLKRFTFGEGVVDLRDMAPAPVNHVTDNAYQEALMGMPTQSEPAPESPRQVPLMILPPQSKPAPVKTRGHAAPPGTGPKGETCGACQHRVSVSTRAGKRFSKCALSRARWTCGAGSDIRRADPACRHWVAKQGKDDGLDKD